MEPLGCILKDQGLIYFVLEVATRRTKERLGHTWATSVTWDCFALVKSSMAARWKSSWATHLEGGGKVGRGRLVR